MSGDVNVSELGWQQEGEQRTPLTRSSIPIQSERHRISIASRRDCSSAVTAIPDFFLRGPDELTTLWLLSSPPIWNKVCISSRSRAEGAVAYDNLVVRFFSVSQFMDNLHDNHDQIPLAV